MCLVTSYRARRNPKTDINVYKVLIHHNGKILAPFTLYEYELDKIIEDEAKEEVTGKHAAKLIKSGYFHACTTLDAAKRLISTSFEKVKKEKIFIHHAIVPAGTKYYTDNGGCICAKPIKVSSEVCV